MPLSRMQYPSRACPVDESRRGVREDGKGWHGMNDECMCTAQHSTAHREAYTAHLTSRHSPLIITAHLHLSPWPASQPSTQHPVRSARRAGIRTRSPANNTQVPLATVYGVHSSTALPPTAFPKQSHTSPSHHPIPQPPAPPRSAPDPPRLKSL